MPALRTDVSDGALIERTRRGDRGAYGELWQRHAASARTVARSYSSLDPDDLVAESFTKIYDAVLAGGGPTGAFRPYLFTTLRNTAASWGRARRETNLETLESFEDPASSESASLDALDRSTTAQAFRSLPTRWQEVLWYSEVEGMHPQQIAPLVGMSANATAALAYRAREGLRQAWIQAHLKNANEPECRWTIDRLGSYTRGKLRSRDTTKLEAHLDDCAKCTIVAAEAREVGSRLALVLLPLTAGIGGATAYSAWLSQGAPAVHVALGAAGMPAVLTGASGAGASGVGASGAAGASGASGSAAGAGASGGAAASGGTAGTSGVAIGAGVGTVVLAAAVAAVVIAVPNLFPLGATEPPNSEVVVVEPAPLPDVAGPVLPPPVPPAPVVPVVDDELDAPADDAPNAAAPAPAPTQPPAPEPVDTIALGVTFTADTAGGLVDPLLTGTAEAGASVVVTAGDGSTWATTADPAGAWSLVAGSLPAGTTLLTATQTDVAGNTSPASAPVAVDLASPSLDVRASGPLVWHLDFAGVPGATVEVLLSGTPYASVELDGAGLAKYIGHGMGDPLDAEVRYAAVGRTGPAATATVTG